MVQIMLTNEFDREQNNKCFKYFNNNVYSQEIFSIKNHIVNITKKKYFLRNKKYTQNFNSSTLKITLSHLL